MEGTGIGQFIPLILIFVIFYFFLIRPQQKKVKEHKAMVEGLRKGDKIVTSGGITGTITRIIDNDKVEVENLINKIESNQDIEENQIKPIVNNIKSKKEKGTYSEEFAMTAFRYVVDGQIKSTVSENFRNKVASELLSKYVWKLIKN